jgi:hypothetical protein
MYVHNNVFEVSVWFSCKKIIVGVVPWTSVTDRIHWFSAKNAGSVLLSFQAATFKTGDCENSGDNMTTAGVTFRLRVCFEV